MKQSFPEIVEKTESDVNTLIAEIKESNLSDTTKSFIIKCVEVSIWVPNFLQKKNISINRFRVIIFGKGYKNRNKKGTSKNNESTDDQVSNEQTTQQDTPINDPDRNSGANPNEAANNHPPLVKAGHGKMPHTVYTDAKEIKLPIDLSPGDDCPLECGGKLGPFKPGIFIRIKGQNIASVTRYELEKLRCNLCGEIFKANIPMEVGQEKYDNKFKAMLTLLKYYVAIPFYRQENFQKLLGFPLPDSTQWYIIEPTAGCYYPVFNYLIRLGANGHLCFGDDTRVIILQVIKEIKADNIKNNRTGMYTSGFIIEINGHKIALFINGRQHAGENLKDILKHRTKEEPIIQMADALSMNVPKGIKTILCNCLSHGFRKFKDLVDYFPEQSLFIMSKLGEVYDIDEETSQMSDEDRLLVHQKKSQPIMEEVKCYMDKLLSEHITEPNSELGKSIRYMQNHWKKLTKFLTVAGAPLCNNVVERALKIAIRNRKSAMFYRSCYSAQIGGMMTSLIYTCQLAGENPLDYLTALLDNPESVTKSPQAWLPWNYQQTMGAVANLQEQLLPLACPVAV